jgi:hypothetical protein
VALTALALVTAGWANAQPAAERRDAAEQEAPARSARGRLSLMRPHPSVVVGEALDVVAILPPGAAADAPQVAVLSWIEASDVPFAAKLDARRIGSPVEIPDVAKGGKFARQVRAPILPGRHELRLTLGTTLLDVLPVSVGMGRIADGVQLAKRVYRFGESIEFAAHLPADRYFHWGNGGPVVLVWPVERDGRRLSDAESAKAWLDECRLCDQWFLRELKSDPSLTDAPGRFRLTLDGAAVPTVAGRYVLRLTDRPRFGDLGRLPLHAFTVATSEEFVVESPGASPTTLRFVRLRPAAAPAAGARPAPVYDEVTELTHGEPFHVEAMFAPGAGTPEPPERSVTLEWVDGGARQTRTVSVRRLSAGLYRSGPIVLARPVRRGQ